MLRTARTPCGKNVGEEFLNIEPVGGRGIRVAFEHDERGGPSGMGCREQRSCRERTDAREKDRLAAVEVVENCGDAVGPLLQSRQRIGRDRIGRPGSWLVEEDESTERCHRLDPRLNRR